MRMENKAGKALLSRLGCALMALVMMMPLLTAGAEVTHGMVVVGAGGTVNFRPSHDTSDFYDRLPAGWVAKVLSQDIFNGVTWYKVETNVPVALSRTYVGYIRGDFFRMLSQEEEAAWLVSKPQPFTGAATPTQAPATATPAPTAAVEYMKVIGIGYNIRPNADGTGLGIGILFVDQVVKVTEKTSSAWYKVDTGTIQGYFPAAQLRALTEQELADLNRTPTPAPTAAPAGTGTLEITLPNTNLRKTPAGESIWKYRQGRVLPYSGSPVYASGYYWMKVTDPQNSLTGYVRSDCYIIRTGGETTPTPSPAPTGAPTAGPGQNSIRIIMGGVNLRQTPGGAVIGLLSRNSVLPFFGAPTAFGGYNWVYAYDDVSKKYGYVRSDCYEYVQGAPTPVITPSPTPSGTLAPAAGSLRLIKGGVNLRATPGGLTIAQLDRGLVMNYTSFTQQFGYTWYLVNSPKGVGYVRSDVIELVQPTDGTPTPAPSATPGQGTMGYIVTVKSEINIRKTPSSSALILGRLNKAQVLPLTGPVRTGGGYNWFQISTLGQTGYLRGDCARQMTAGEVAAYLTNGTIPSLTPPGGGGTPQINGYVMTTMTSVNVRKSPSQDAATLGQIAEAGKVFPYYNAVDSGGRMWYKILYNGAEGYLLGSTARLMTVQEYTDYLNTLPTPTPPPAPTPTPRPEDMSKTAITRIEKVIVRSGAGMSNRELTILYRKGTVVELQGPTGQADGQTWYEVRVSGINGWIRGDLLRVLTKEEEAIFKQTGDPDSPKTATYRTLQLGSTGEDVTRLQQELNRQGYLQSAYITGIYNDQTASAVRAFQQAKGLVVDGIAGSATQHKLFNTVPEGTYDPGGGGTVTPEINPVELVDWVTGDINSFWGRGEAAVMTDVKTKISLRIKRWAGGDHVDGEPLTAADTAALCKVYGVKSAQEILEKNLYQRRPVWITIKGRTFAASLYGVPHNYPDGDTIPGNDYNGQLCVHFVNSRIHSSGKVDPDHMKAIQDAYNAAPTKK